MGEGHGTCVSQVGIRIRVSKAAPFASPSRPVLNRMPVLILIDNVNTKLIPVLILILILLPNQYRQQLQ